MLVESDLYKEYLQKTINPPKPQKNPMTYQSASDGTTNKTISSVDITHKRNHSYSNINNVTM